MLKSRTFLYLVIGLSAVLALVVGGLFLYDTYRIRTVVIATNEEGSQSYIIMDALAKSVRRADDRVSIKIIQTNGSAEIMELLRTGKADFGTAQLDAELNDQIQTVALLYPQVFHMVVKADSDIRTPADLKGKKIATTSQNGGSYQSAFELLGYYGVDDDEVEVIPFEDGDLRDAAFLNGDVDAMFRANTIGSDGFRDLAATTEIRFLELEQFDSMRIQFPYLFQYVIPKGTYLAANPVTPLQDTKIVGVPTVLFANTNVDPAIVELFTEVLFDNQNDIVQKTTQGIWIESPVKYQTILPAIHPGAMTHYNGDPPDFFERYYNLLSLLLTFGPVLASIYFAMLARFQERQKSTASHYNLELAKLLADLTYTKKLRVVQYIERSLFESLNEVVAAMEDGNISSTDLQVYSLVWEKAMDAVKRRYDTLKKPVRRKKRIIK
ncbi:MAG: TAXI family TRAP transporter solute-binding subunit [Anaerolineae bacterium]|nr:TAXI family TRAP transporter solute-binding subunit [Anaerolineae bacterium]